MLSKADRILIEVFRYVKRYGAKKIMSEFPKKNLLIASVKLPAASD